jgi:hypothetical protein
MGENWWTDDDDDDAEDVQPNKAELPKPARDHLRKIERELKALREENSTLKASSRKASVSDLVKAKGYDPEIAELVPSSVEATDEAVTKWLESKGKLFAKMKTEDTPTEDATGEPGEGFELPPELLDALGRVSNASSGSVTPTKPADAMSKIQGAKNPAELIEFLKSQGATV